MLLQSPLPPYSRADGFWCTESDFEKLAGVIEAESGYTDGHVENPSYKQVSAGGTGHTEGVLVTYDPDVVSYEELVEYFWPTIDPTQADAQFCDHGSQYRSAIYYDSPEEKSIVEASLAKLQASKPFSAAIVTQIGPRSKFYLAEDYHQNYYKKNPIRIQLLPKGLWTRSTFRKFVGRVSSSLTQDHFTRAAAQVDPRIN